MIAGLFSRGDCEVPGVMEDGTGSALARLPGPGGPGSRAGSRSDVRGSGHGELAGADDRPPLSEARALDQLGDTYQASGQPAAARAAWQQAVDIFGQLAQPEEAGPVLAKIRDFGRGGQRVARPL